MIQVRQTQDVPELVRNDARSLEGLARAVGRARNRVSQQEYGGAVEAYVMGRQCVAQPEEHAAPVGPDGRPTARRRDLLELEVHHVDDPVVVTAVRDAVRAVVVELREVDDLVGQGHGLHQEIPSPGVVAQPEALAHHLGNREAGPYPRGYDPIDLHEPTRRLEIEVRERAGL